MGYSLRRSSSILGLLSLVHTVVAFHNGAPCSTQYTMTPSTIFHGVPQNPGPRPPPYQFEITDSQGNPVTKYKDHVYKIIVTGVNTSFRGFLMQARPATAEGYPIGHLRAGMFISDGTWQLQGVKTQPCPGVFNDSLTHATNDDRSALQVQWKPIKNHGPVLFMLTIVQNRTLFWTQWLPSSGLIFPEEGAKFAAGGGKAGRKASAKVIEEVEATTPTPEADEETTVDAGSGDSTAEAEETTTIATTKPPRAGKGRGASPRSRKKLTTTKAAPVEVTDAETAEEVPITEAAQGKKAPEAAPPPPPPPPPPAPAPSAAPGSDRSDRLPPAPAAGAGGDDSEGDELKLVTRRPAPKGKKGRPEAGPAGDVEVSTHQPEGTNGPDDSEFGPPPAHPPSPSSTETSPPLPSDKRPKGKSEKLPPAAPAGAEEFPELLLSNGTAEKPPERLQQRPTLPPLAAPPPAGAPPGPAEADTTDYCAEKPCINNGTCINVPDEERYDCRCPPKWAGPQCAATNLCEKHKCKNGAECVNGENKYTCKCAREWGGEFCDKSCPVYLCENGGTCIISGLDQYGCICAPGYTGQRCHDEIKHCDSNPCQNGATCVHRFNAFDCKCRDGYMGETCHRPCRDIYHSCDFWGEQEKCETQRPQTKWFDINCARTCGQCKFDNRTANLTITAPPVLEPFEFILGRWTFNATSKSRFPVDFIHNNTNGYFEELIFSLAEVPQFGPPSINVTAIAVNNLNPKDIMTTVGFLTVRPATVPLRTFLMTTGNDGITAVEDGFMNNTVIQLNSTYFAILPWVDDRAPATAKRTFSIVNQYLKEDVERTTNSGQKDYFTKYYWRQEKFPVY